MFIVSKFPRLLALLGLFVFTGTALASTDGTDKASNYSSSGWTNGSNGGTGFGAWSFTNAGTAGQFLGDSTYLGNGNSGSSTGINSNGLAFGMYANNGTSSTNDSRSFAGGALTGGQDFSVDLAVNYRNGGKGIDLRDAGGNTLFTFNTTGDDYVVSNAATNDGSVGNTYSANTEFHLDFSQTSTSGGIWTITRSGGVSATDTGTYTGDAAAFNLFVYNTSNDTESDFYANNLAITGVPEPATCLGGLLMVGAAGYGLRRRLRPFGGNGFAARAA